MDLNLTDHCRTNCLGVTGTHGACCTVEDRNWIMGPIRDSEEFLANLRLKYPNLALEWKDVFMDFDEGSKLFPTKSNYQDPASYPALRIDLDHKRRPCIMYNTQLKCCTVYEIRPQTCRTFFCPYLVSLKK